MKYIDAEKLIAEVERRRLSNRYIDTEGYEAELFEIIDSLQQEQTEVDLEKEIEKAQEHYFALKEQGFSLDSMDVSVLARHFYELGIKEQTQKQ